VLGHSLSDRALGMLKDLLASLLGADLRITHLMAGLRAD
jgi:hypothetical protein